MGERGGRMIVSLVERGWQAAREYSLEAQGDGLSVVHLVKGRLSREVHALIVPFPHIRIISVPRLWFWPGAWLMMGWAGLTGRLRSLLVDNARSYRRFHRWTRLLHVELLMMEGDARRPHLR